MADQNLQIQIDQINNKLDILLEESEMQKQNRQTVVDLVDDMSIVGKDAFKGMVDSLDKAGIEVDGDQVNHLLLNFIRNINNMNIMFQTLENITDLLKDASPIIKQIGIDATDKFNEIDRKGYFEVLNQTTIALDRIISRYSRPELENLSDNIISTVDTLLAIADPAVMKKVKIFADTYKDIDVEQVPEYSIWKVMRELNKPEMKKSIGFIMTLLRRINADNLSASDKN